MPANVETFASLRQPAWHGLGTVFLEPVTTEEMLRIAGLNGWDVRIAELELPAPSARQWFAVIRTNPATGLPEVLGVVGKRYNPFQNEELFNFGDAMLEYEGRWETAGSLAGGSVVFGSLALDHRVVLDPTGVEDVIDSYLLVSTSHDGSLAIRASVTPTRVVCMNTLNLALRNAKAQKQSFAIRHTDKAEEKVAIARAALGLAHDFITQFEEDANVLLSTKVTPKVWNDILLNLYPKPEVDAKGSVTKWENKITVLNDIYTGPTNGMIAGTAWGALNALTERLDWYRNGRGDNADENIAAAASGFDVAVNAEKVRIRKAVRTLAGVK